MWDGSGVVVFRFHPGRNRTMQNAVIRFLVNAIGGVAVLLVVECASLLGQAAVVAWCGVDPAATMPFLWQLPAVLAVLLWSKLRAARLRRRVVDLTSAASRAQTTSPEWRRIRHHLVDDLGLPADVVDRAQIALCVNHAAGGRLPATVAEIAGQVGRYHGAMAEMDSILRSDASDGT
jgi:hypothetical protein